MDTYMMKHLSIDFKRLCNRNGFTIADFLASCVVCALVFAAIWTIFVFIQPIWANSLARVDMERGATIGLERMARGIKGVKGIRESKTVTTPTESATTTYIDFKDDVGITRRFYYSAPDKAVRFIEGVDDTIIATNVKQASFTKTGRIITIQMTMEKMVQGYPLQAFFTTNIMCRNQYY